MFPLQLTEEEVESLGLKKKDHVMSLQEEFDVRVWLWHTNSCVTLSRGIVIYIFMTYTDNIMTIH